MKAGWTTTTLGEACELATGGTPSRARPEFFGGDIPWLVSGDVNQREIRECEGRITEAGLRSCNTKLLPNDSVMIALNGQGKTRATVAMLRMDGATCNQSLVCISPKDRSRLIPEFVFANLCGRYEELRRLTGDDDKDRRGLNMGILRNIRIPFPAIDEQRRIVAILNEAFAGIATAKANAERSLRHAREILSEALIQVFSTKTADWAASTIGGCTTFIDYRGRTPNKIDAGLRLITAKNVKMGYVQREPEEFVAPDSYDAWMTRGIPVKGDVLFTTEAPCGNVAQLDTDEKVVFAQRIIIMQPDARKLDSTFLKYALLSPVLQKRIQANATGATAIGIKASLLRAIEISFPQVKDQVEIVEELDALQAEAHHLESLYIRKLAALDELRQSLLQQAFSGQL